MITTFQAIVYAAVHGFTVFIPVSWAAHDWLIHFLVGWPVPSGAFSGALSLGALLSLLVYFRHDWASILSSLLRVLFLFRKPMTLDERLPFFIVLTSLPAALIYIYLKKEGAEPEIGPYWVAGSLVLFSLPFLLADYLNRKNKSMLDWNWLDSLIVGICQVLILVPGAGRQIGALTGAMLRNYQPEAAAKYCFLSFLPVLIAYVAADLNGISFSAEQPMEGMSWLSFGMAVLVTFFAGLLSIGGFMKNVATRRFGPYALYRFVIAAGIIIVYFYRK